MMKVYKTGEVARIIGIHSNTVRLYEELGLIPVVKRQPNGYRVFTDFHIDQPIRHPSVQTFHLINAHN